MAGGERKRLLRGKADEIEIQVRDAIGNEYGRSKDVAGESRIVFTSHADAAFDVCFENLMVGRTLPQLKGPSSLFFSKQQPPPLTPNSKPTK